MLQEVDFCVPCLDAAVRNEVLIDAIIVVEKK